MPATSKWLLVPTLLFSVPAIAAPQFMNFPVRGKGPYTRGIMSSVLDHEVPHKLDDSLPFKQKSTDGPFGFSGAVLSFTGELFVASANYPMQNLGCYQKPANSNQGSTWSNILATTYTGSGNPKIPGNCTTKVALNYDNHPGYDYLIDSGTAVYPAASGYIISSKCIKTFTDSQTCEAFGAIAVDHGNGFITQYLHMAKVDYGKAAGGVNQWVDTSRRLGNVSNVGAPSIHLHLEVLQRKAKPVNTKDYYNRSNYVIVDPYGYKTSSYYADKLYANPGCLWIGGCQF